MKNLILTTLFALLFNVTIPLKSKASECSDMRKECLEECNENYAGNTFWDGAGRFACRAGCELAEGVCNVKEFIDELI